MKIIEKITKLQNGFSLADQVTLGLDMGIASCGWALLDKESETIIGVGTWGFEVSEVAKTRESKTAVRRVFRGQRRRLRRRRIRMREIRKLLHENSLLDSAKPPADQKGIAKPNDNPWALRAEGLERQLTGPEFACALIHIAKHRGYRSNSKSEKATNAPSEDKKVLVGLANIEEKSAKYKTVGAMFARDPEFADKKRNKHGDYSHTVLRSLHEEEITELFKAQRKLGNTMAGADMEVKYAALAFDQLPLQDSEKMLGHCPFEPEEYRASSLAFSFEKFRFVSKLNNIRLVDETNAGRLLSKGELSKAVNGFGKAAKISWAGLRNLLGLPNSAKFIGVGDKQMSTDMARASKGCAYGSNTLYKVLGEAAWNSLVKTPKTLDLIAHELTFRDDVSNIEKGLRALDLEPAIFTAIMDGVNAGAFSGFSKAGHISTLAARNILPGLMDRLTYDKACDLAEYDHAKENIADLDSLTNPVAKRAIVETLKQVNALVRHYGFRPGAIHIEMARDVGKGPEERGRITKGIARRTADRAKAKTAFCELVGKSDCSFGELQRYELWQEQQHDCMFCFPRKEIKPHDLCDGKHAVEIEHILPISRSQDNSWHNKVLACVKCNQDKKANTPFEWFGKNADRWDEFEYRVKSAFNDKNIKGFKIRNLLIRDFKDRQEGFISRNLNDTRYAARVVGSELKNLFSTTEVKSARRIYARPGQITSILRKLWGLERLKYLPRVDGKKDRIEDERHHCVDAMIVAACTEGCLNNLTKTLQYWEEKGLPPLKIPNFKPPWDDFAQQVIEARDMAPVARSENRRARGAGHAATIRQIRSEEGRRIIYERVGIDKITKASLERLKDPDRNRDVYDNVFAWIAAGKPEDTPPTRNNGYPIKKITLRAEKNPTTERAGFKAHGGLVDNADMVRVDVFTKDKKFYLVPIYAHQVADRQNWPTPPNRAIPTTTQPEHDWLVVDDSFLFKFSLYPFSWIETINTKGEIKEGYYRGTGRSTGSVTISEEVSRQKYITSIGCKTLHSFKKYQVDRLGQKHEIKLEVRTWRGVACT